MGEEVDLAFKLALLGDASGTLAASLPPRSAGHHMGDLNEFDPPRTRSHPAEKGFHATSFREITREHSGLRLRAEWWHVPCSERLLGSAPRYANGAAALVYVGARARSGAPRNPPAPAAFVRLILCCATTLRAGTRI